MQGYVTFVDGSAYVYTAPSNVEFEALCAALQRGRQFNFQVRRSRLGYVKGFTPPPDFDVIYTYPPYPGVTPSACPLTNLDWANLFWTALSEIPCGSEVWSWDNNGSSGANQRLGASAGTFICTSTFHMQGVTDYTMGGSNSEFLFHAETFATGGTWTVNTVITVNGVVVVNDVQSGPVDVTVTVPFTMPDPGGAVFPVVVDVFYTVNVGFGHANFICTHFFQFA